MSNIARDLVPGTLMRARVSGELAVVLYADGKSYPSGFREVNITMLTNDSVLRTLCLSEWSIHDHWEWWT